jgi:ABC-type lipoprotein release transport system permease subunit
MLGSFLYGVGAGDASAYAGAAVLLVACICAASMVPARRAARHDPSASLRTS